MLRLTPEEELTRLERGYSVSSLKRLERRAHFYAHTGITPPYGTFTEGDLLRAYVEEQKQVIEEENERRAA